MQRCARIPGFAFLRSRVPGILGSRARENANFIQDRGNAERERIGTLYSRSCKETTGQKAPPPRAAHILYTSTVYTIQYTYTR